MHKQNRMMTILKDTTGASFMFVLGIMTLLMTIGISALVAASANTGFTLKQKEHSQIMLLDDAVHKNIMYSLQHDPKDPNLLSRQIIEAIYDEAKNAKTAINYEPPTYFGTIELEDIKINGSADWNSSNVQVQRITFSFPDSLEEMVKINDPKPAVHTPAIYDDGGGLVTPQTLDKAREPKTVFVNVKMIVTVEMNANGKIVTSRAVYEYTSGMLSDDPDIANPKHANDTSALPFESDMDFVRNRPDGTDGYGQWRMIKHESTDTEASS